MNMQLAWPLSTCTRHSLSLSSLRLRYSLSERGLCLRRFSSRKPAKEDMSRIYLAGSDNLATFAACALRSTDTPVTLLANHNRQLQAYLDHGSRIRVESELGGRLLMECSDVKMEVIQMSDTVISTEHLGRAVGARHYQHSSLGAVVTKDSMHMGEQNLRNEKSLKLAAKRSSSVEGDPDSSLQQAKTSKTLTSEEVNNLPPIMNLIYSGHMSNVERTLKHLEPRLLPGSTILFITRGLGILEEVYEGIYKDPLKRPTCLVGHLTQGVHAFDKEIEKENTEDSHKKLRGIADNMLIRDGEALVSLINISKSLKWNEDGEFRIREMSNIRDETYERNTLRKLAAKYLIKTLKENPHLRGKIIPRKDSLFLAFHHIRDFTIINPLLALSGILPGELRAMIRDNPMANELFERSLREVVSVLQRIVPEYTLEMARMGVLDNLEFKFARIHRLVHDLVVGGIPDTRCSSDWLIKQAKLKNVAIPNIEALRKEVLYNAEQRAIETQKFSGRDERRRSSGRGVEGSSDDDVVSERRSNPERRSSGDQLDIKRERKAQKIKENIGKSSSTPCCSKDSTGGKLDSGR